MAVQGGMNVVAFPGRKPNQVGFTRDELTKILDVYGRMVAAGQWRDYALDCLPEMAVFSIFRHTSEAPIYKVSKIVTKGKRQSSKFTVSDGDRVVKQSQSLLEVLGYFKERKEI